MSFVSALALFVLSLASLFALAGSARAEDSGESDESTCVTCHEVESDEELAICVPEWRESVHASQFVSCDACHGGDPREEDADASMSEDAGFLELPGWDEHAVQCGACHEDVAETWLAGRFGTTTHGERVATCVDCHMREGHRILAAIPEELEIHSVCPDCLPMPDPDGALAILRRIESTEVALAAAISTVESNGIDMTDSRVGIEQVHAAFARTVHAFDPDSLEAASALALTQYAGLAEQVGVLDVEAGSRRRLGIGLVAALTLLLLALFALLASSRMNR